MDRRLLSYYERELQHLREMGAEFKRAYPKIAGRLALDEFSCADPYVERLLEGFALLAARVQLKLDSQFPRFTQSLLQTLYPHYLAPTPSMVVVQFQPDLAEGGLAEGITLPRGSVLRSLISRQDPTACEYRTAHELTLWPITVTSASYHTRDIGTLQLPAGLPPMKAAIRMRLSCPPALKFEQILLDRLPLFLRGTPELQTRLYEQIIGHGIGMVVQPAVPQPKHRHVQLKGAISQRGFDPGDALLPYDARSFQGYRLLHEYFAFPQRFLFVELSGLREGLAGCPHNEVDVVILLREADVALEGMVDAGSMAPHCTPAVNLFPKNCDRIHLTEQHAEFQVVPDRTRPLDYEVYQVRSVTGYGTRSDDEQAFAAFYSARDLEGSGGGAYYTVNRVPRLPTAREQRTGQRSSYAGSEVYVSLVDATAAPYRSELRQLGVEALCTNRDLPIFLPIGRGQTDFALQVSAPVTSIRSASGAPTSPRPSWAEGEIAWRLISHLSLNYLSLTDVRGGDHDDGAAGLRDILELYGETTDQHIRNQIRGVKNIASEPAIRRLLMSGPISFVRGLRVTVQLEEAAFEGTGAFLLGAVLDRFFSRYVSINSFTETVVRTVERGEVMRWPARTGQAHTL